LPIVYFTRLTIAEFHGHGKPKAVNKVAR
jgi:hypothetical protein